VRGDADDVVARRFEHSLSFLVVLMLYLMDSAVNLNDQSMLRAEEVHNKRPNCLLATKLRSIQLPVPQCSPKPLLRWRGLRPKFARQPHHLPGDIRMNRDTLHVAHTLPNLPSPLHRNGEGPGVRFYFPSVTYHWFALIGIFTAFGMRFLTRLLTVEMLFGKSVTSAGASTRTRFCMSAYICVRFA
jgi:hypothetical protein